MFLRVSRQKLASGKTIAHYQLAESVWDREKRQSRTRILYSFGRVDDKKRVTELRKMARSILRLTSPDDITAEHPDWQLVDATEYGGIHVLEQLWRKLGMDEIFRKQAAPLKLAFDLERAVFAMVANRVLAPASKLYCFEQWLREDVYIEGISALSLHHLYRAMDVLLAHKDEIEEKTYFQVTDLLNLDVDLIFYDTTSLHFEADEEDAGLRKRGHAKNGRSDVPQIVVGMAVTRDGLPVRHWVFPGNTVDVSTVRQVKEALRGWRLGRCLFVGDAGMVSAENLRTLALGGGRYITSVPAHRGGEVAEQVLTCPGRYHTVAYNMKVKEVIIGDGERRRRYVLCHNPDEEKRQRKHRERVIAELEAELASLRQDGHHSKRACQLIARPRYRRYLRQTKTGKLRINRAAIRQAEKMDGKFVVHSNDDTLSAEDMVLGYKQLMRVEQAWRSLKSSLKVRPVYHWTEHRIKAHIFISVLALLLVRVAERACADTWRNIHDDVKRIKLVQLLGDHGMVWQTTVPPQKALNRLKNMEITKPEIIIKTM